MRLFLSLLILMFIITPLSAGVREVTVFDGHEGWMHSGVTYRLACAVNLAEAANGDLLISWLSGTDSEPATDNCVLIARSTDGGNTWSQPSILVPCGEDASHVTNMFTMSDGTLVALGAYWPSEDEYTTWYYFRMVSNDNGKTWTQPERFTLLDNYASLGRRIQLDDGSWLFPGTFFQKRDAPLHGDYTAIAQANNEAEAVALANKYPELNTNKFSRFLHGCMAFGSNETAKTIEPLGRIDNRPLGLIEPSVVQLSDGKLIMLMRAEWGGFLWRSESTDRGQSWTPAVATGIKNPSSMAQLLALPGNRIALFLNPTGGKIGGRGSRDPLAMWISDDQMQTWKTKRVLAEGARCAYPHAVVTQDGQLLVAYDRDRREVRLVHVSNDELTDK